MIVRLAREEEGVRRVREVETPEVESTIGSESSCSARVSRNDEIKRGSYDW